MAHEELGDKVAHGRSTRTVIQSNDFICHN
jgi:hypothetical protein